MKKVILVEDDPIITKAYRFHLEKEGYQIETAADGEAGWNAIQQNPPDVVLLDLMMPRLSGKEVLRQLKCTPSLAHIPVIVFTNAFVPAMVNEAREAGASMVFDKGTATPRMIIEALKDALSTPRGQ